MRPLTPPLLHAFFLLVLCLLYTACTEQKVQETQTPVVSYEPVQAWDTVSLLLPPPFPAPPHPRAYEVKILPIDSGRRLLATAEAKLYLYDVEQEKWLDIIDCPVPRGWGYQYFRNILSGRDGYLLMTSMYFLEGHNTLHTIQISDSHSL